MSETINIIQIGTGRIGYTHLLNIKRNPRTNLVGIVVKNPGKEHNQSISKEFGAPLFHSVEEALEKSQKKIDGVVIASSTDQHVPHIRNCIEKNLAVFCEKPVALQVEEIDACFKLAEEKNVPLFCAYQRRFDPHFSELKKKIKDGAIGQVHLVKLTSRDHPPPPQEFLKSAGSFFQDFATHDVDVARWLLEEEPESIQAFASTFLLESSSNAGPVTPDDTAIIVMKFPSGAMCIIDNSRRATYGYDIRAEVLGSKGMLEMQNPSKTTVRYSNEEGLIDDPLHHSFPERFEQAYYNELDHWVDIITQGTKSRVSQKDCSAAAAITLQCQRTRDAFFNSLPPRQIASPRTSVPRHVINGTVGAVVVGVGRMGQVRADALAKLPNVKILYAVDIEPNSLASFASKYSCKALPVDRLGEALQDPAVHAVFISTTSHTHRDIILAAAKAKKNIFCEKPLALSAQDTVECVNAVKENQVTLYCGFQRRSDPHFVKLKEKVSEVGQVELVRVSSRDGASHNSAAYLLSSGGYFYDSLIHDFDIARWIVGQEPVAVYCTGNAFIPEIKEAGDIDCVVVMLYFPNGTICSIDNHRRAMYGYDQRLEVHTATGQFATRNEHTSMNVWSTKHGLSHDKPPAGLVRYSKAYESEVFHFIKLLTDANEKPRVTEDDCVFGAYIADAAKESLVTGKVVFIDQPKSAN